MQKNIERKKKEAETQFKTLIENRNDTEKFFSYFKKINGEKNKYLLKLISENKQVFEIFIKHADRFTDEVARIFDFLQPKESADILLKTLRTLIVKVSETSLEKNPKARNYYIDIEPINNIASILARTSSKAQIIDKMFLIDSETTKCVLDEDLALTIVNSIIENYKKRSNNFESTSTQLKRLIPDLSEDEKTRVSKWLET